MPVDFRQLDNSIYKSVLENFTKVIEGDKNRQLEGQKAQLAAGTARRGQDIQADSAAAQLAQLTEAQGLQRDASNVNSLRTQQTALVKEELIQGRHEDTFGLNKAKEGFDQEAETARIGLDNRRVGLLEGKEARDEELFRDEQRDKQELRDMGAKYGLNGIKQKLIEQGHAGEALKIDKLAGEIDNNILKGKQSVMQLRDGEEKFTAGQKTKALVDMSTSFINNPDKKVAMSQLRISAQAYDDKHGTNMSSYSDNQLAATVTAMASAQSKTFAKSMTDPTLRGDLGQFAQGWFGLDPIPLSKQGKEAKDAQSLSGINIGAPSIVINAAGNAEAQNTNVTSNFDTNMGGDKNSAMSFQSREWE